MEKVEIDTLKNEERQAKMAERVEYVCDALSDQYGDLLQELRVSIFNACNQAGLSDYADEVAKEVINNHFEDLLK